MLLLGNYYIINKSFILCTVYSVHRTHVIYMYI